VLQLKIENGKLRIIVSALPTISFHFISFPKEIPSFSIFNYQFSIRPLGR